jgi:hypothetical protein
MSKKLIVDVSDRLKIDYLNNDNTIHHSEIRTIKTIKHHNEDLYLVTFRECQGEYAFTMDALEKMVLLRY